MWEEKICGVLFALIKNTAPKLFLFKSVEASVLLWSVNLLVYGVISHAKATKRIYNEILWTNQI